MLTTTEAIIEPLAPDNEITQKDLRSRIFSMVWPATIESVLQMLVGIVATGMVGRIGAQAVAAVGLSSRITQIMWAIFAAIGTGATVLIARSIGAGNQRAAHRTASQALALAVVVVGMMTVAIWVKAEACLVFLFHPEPSLLATAYSFLRLAAWGMPFMAIMQVIGAILRGAGNTKTPMQIAFVVNVINVIANFAFIYGKLGFVAMGITGAALAMIVSQGIGAVLAIYSITRPLSQVSLKFAGKFVVDLAEVKRILGIGVPAALESLFWQTATIIMMGLIVSFGTDALAAHQLGLNAESLSYMPTAGFGIAATAFVGQSLGARNPRLAERYVKEIGKWGVALTCFTGGLLFFFPYQILRLLTNEPSVIRLGAIYLRLMATVQLPQLVSGVLNGALRGAGDTRAPMVIGGIGLWGIRLPFSFLLGRTLGFGIVGVWLAMIIDLVIRFGLSMYRYRRGKWKEIRLLDVA